MPRIIVYGRESCPFTQMASRLAGTEVLDPAGMQAGLMREVRQAGHTTVPMCFDLDRSPGGRFIGGFDELQRYHPASSGGGGRGAGRGRGRGRGRGVTRGRGSSRSGRK